VAHREWNWAQWTRPRLLFGLATDKRYRRWFVGQLLECVGEGAAVAAAEPDASPPPAPADAAAPLLADLIKQHAAGLCTSNFNQPQIDKIDRSTARRGLVGLPKPMGHLPGVH